MCTDVCARGSVVVEPWLAHAIKQQTKLVQTLPLCYQFLVSQWWHSTIPQQAHRALLALRTLVLMLASVGCSR